VDRAGAAWITLGRCAGALAGLAVLAVLPTGSLRVFIGFATILTVGASLMGGSFKLGRPVLLGAGLITGITETATGIGGPPMALAYQHQPGPVLRATLAACFLGGVAAAGARLGRGRDAVVLWPAGRAAIAGSDAAVRLAIGGGVPRVTAGGHGSGSNAVCFTQTMVTSVTREAATT